MKKSVLANVVATLLALSVISLIIGTLFMAGVLTKVVEHSTDIILDAGVHPMLGLLITISLMIAAVVGTVTPLVKGVMTWEKLIEKFAVYFRTPEDPKGFETIVLALTVGIPAFAIIYGAIAYWGGVGDYATAVTRMIILFSLPAYVAVRMILAMISSRILCRPTQ